MNRTFKGLGAFGREFPAIAGNLQKRLGTTAQRELGDEALETAVRLTPVGGSRDPHPGQLKKSWERRAATGTSPEAIGSDVEYGSIINRGRRRSKNLKARPRANRKGEVVEKGKMLGSAAARAGLTRPAVRLLMKRKEQIAAKVVAAVEGRGDR